VGYEVGTRHEGEQDRLVAGEDSRVTTIQGASCIAIDVY